VRLYRRYIHRRRSNTKSGIVDTNVSTIDVYTGATDSNVDASFNGNLAFFHAGAHHV
jgi:hypothetical protein